MSVVHISEQEASVDLSHWIDRVEQGEMVFIDRKDASFALVRQPQRRTVQESLEILRNLPGERGVMDADFAADVRKFREGLDDGFGRSAD